MNLYKRHTERCKNIQEEMSGRTTKLEEDFKKLREESLKESQEFQQMLDSMNAESLANTEIQNNYQDQIAQMQQNGTIP